MWQKVFKFLCWFGWHMWEYVYSTSNLASGKPVLTPLLRRCKKCGEKQQHSKVLGKWTNG